MSKEVALVSGDKVEDVINVLEKAFYDIPFENSDFQNQNFVIAAQITPARAYRAIGLKMFAKIRAVKEAIASIQLSDIDLEENEYLSSLESTSNFDKRRLAIENARIRDSRKWTEKLFNDAIRELNCLYSEFKKYPKYTREQFEAEERLHFQIRLEQQMQLNGNGAAESLTNMNGNAINIERMLEDPLYLENLVKESTQNLLRVKDEIRTQSN